MSEFECLVLGGGGVKCFSTMGALHYYYTKGALKEIKIFCGTSMGSVISLMLLCGYSPMEILDKFSSVSIPKNINLKLREFFTNYGLINIEIVSEIVEKMVMDKFGTIPTLKSLKDITGKTLIACATNITKSEPEYLCPETHPKLSCLEAVKMSCNIPLFFNKIEYGGCMYADGGILDNFPIAYIDKLHNRKTIGISILGEFDHVESGKSFFSYMYNLMTMPTKELRKLRMRDLSGKCKILDLYVKNVSVTDINTSVGKKMEIFLSGYRDAEMDEELENME